MNIKNLIRVFSCAFFLAIIPSIAHAQTVNKTLVWSQPEPLTTVQGFSYTLKIDATTPTVITPTCVAQVAPLTGTNCTSPVTISNAPHTVTLTAINAFGSTSSSISGAPPQPFTVSITVTVTVP